MPIDPTFVPTVLDYTIDAVLTAPFVDEGIVYHAPSWFSNWAVADVAYPNSSDPKTYYAPLTFTSAVSGTTNIPAVVAPYLVRGIRVVSGGQLQSALKLAFYDQNGVRNSSFGGGEPIVLRSWILTIHDPGNTWSYTGGFDYGAGNGVNYHNSDNISLTFGFNSSNYDDPNNVALRAWVTTNAGTAAVYSGTLTMVYWIVPRFRPNFHRAPAGVFGGIGAGGYRRTSDPAYCPPEPSLPDVFINGGHSYNRVRYMPGPFGDAYPRSGDTPDGYSFTYEANADSLIYDTSITWAWGFTPPPPPTGGPYIVSDVFGGIMVSAWFGAISGGVKTLYVAVDPAPTKNMGSGSGSTAGFDTYVFSASVDGRSDLGLWFTHVGDLVMRYDAYDAGGTKTTKYVTNRQMGHGPAGNWTAPQNVKPNQAQQLGVGRAQAQGTTIRVGN